MKPSTSPGVRSNVGIAKPSPAVRQTGNMRCLLVMGGVYRSSVPRGGTQVKYRCRCRDKALNWVSVEQVQAGACAGDTDGRCSGHGGAGVVIPITDYIVRVQACKTGLL